MARKSIVLEALLRDVADKAPGLSDGGAAHDLRRESRGVPGGERVRVSHMLFREKARRAGDSRSREGGESFEALMKEVGSGNGEVARTSGRSSAGTS